MQYDKKTGVYIVDADVDATSIGCPSCRRLPNFLQKHGIKQRKIADTPVRGLRVVIQVDRQRYICLGCGATTFQPLPGVVGNRRMTTRLAEYIAERATTQTFSAVAVETGQSEKTVRTVFKEHAARVLTTRNPETPRCLGMDDVYVGRVARCVLVDNDRKRLYDLLPRRNKTHIFRFLVQIPNRQLIEVVTIDMCAPFRDAVREALQNAVVVIDRFHIQRALNNAPRKVARDFAPQRKTGKGFSRDSYLLLSGSRRLNEDERAKRDLWLSQEPWVAEAYRTKERILNIWQIPDRAKAEATYDRLATQIPGELQGAFHEFTTSMRNWRAEIFNYWDHPWTNAFAESTNNILKNIQRVGKSYDFATVREKAICRDVGRAQDPHGARDWQASSFNTNFLDPEGRSQQED